MPNINSNKLRRMANAIRFLSIDAVNKAKSGHPGMPMGAADIVTVLFSHFLNFCSDKPSWHNRDRFVLSAGHGSMLLYSLLYLTGYKNISLDDIKNFRQFGAKTAGHPEFELDMGIETTTGPLGQGIANAVGMAIAERKASDMFGKKAINHYTYALAGDGCLMEGVSFEAMAVAANLKLNKLIVLFDDNSISIDGDTSLTRSEDLTARVKASGWNVLSCDGHNHAELFEAISKAKESALPTLIACKTIIGYGSPNKAGLSSAHGEPLGEKERELTSKELDWNQAPFVIPEDILASWRELAAKGKDLYKDWEESVEPEKLTELNNFVNKKSALPALDKIINDLKNDFAAKAGSDEGIASRKSSAAVLLSITPSLPSLVGGSADLSGSNGTMTKNHSVLDSKNNGNYIHYGVREHGMGGIMNGFALWGGFIPYGGTFLVFSDYMRPSIRLAALMGLQVIYVLTHDSIALGEDGPTHQPVEHLASLRLIPNLNVYRPADAVETAECWQLALHSFNAPSVLCLSRQNLKYLRGDASQNLSSKGAYIIKEASQRDLTIIASGSEVEIAMEASETLEKEGIHAFVVSMPSKELFLQQDKKYIDNLLGNAPKIAIEAGLESGWSDILTKTKGASKFIGMKSFGLSAPAKDLYKHFGITADSICLAAKELLK